MKVVKKDATANTQDTLEKKERKKSKNAGIKQMTQTPKTAKGIEKAFPTPGKEKVQSLKEHILDEMTKQNPSFEHFQVGSRVKKKDNSVVGEITEWDGDTATIKTDEGKIVHVQGNVLTHKDVPTQQKETAQTATQDEWASPKTHVPELKGKEDREAKMKALKEKVLKAVKKELEEDSYVKGSGTNASIATGDTPEAQSLLQQKGYKKFPV